MIDIESVLLSDEDINVIKNPHVGGIILFERNFKSRDQIKDLCNLIKDDKIYKLHTAAGLAVVGDYILGEDGKPKNFNPFSNGTYRRRK